MDDDRQLKWDYRFLRLAQEVASWSKDPSTKVGAILTQGNRFVSLGYNGFPRDVIDLESRYNNREVKYRMIVHAEVNAILEAGERARGGSLYVWPTFLMPNICNECAKVFIQAGVEQLIGYEPDADAETKFARWAESIDFSRRMFDDVGVVYRMVPRLGDAK